MTAAAHRELIRAACERLAIEGYLAWPNRTGATEIAGRYIPFGKIGSGDIVGVLNCGTHFEGEGKTGDAVQTREQKIHQSRLEKRNAVYILFHTVDELLGKVKMAEQSRMKPKP